MVQEFGSTQAKRATLPDGPVQQERDRRFKAHDAFVAQKTWDGFHVDEVPDSINSPDWMPWLCGHDAAAFVSTSKSGPFAYENL